MVNLTPGENSAEGMFEGEPRYLDDLPTSFDESLNI
jgi:hypothetical protein